MRARMVGFPRRVWLRLHAKSTSLVVLTIVTAAIAALLAATTPESEFTRLNSSVFVLAVGVPIILAGSLISEDFRGGAIQLWIQRTTDPVGFYLTRLGEALAGGAIFIILAATIELGLFVSFSDSTVADRLIEMPSLLLLAACVSIVGFGLTAWLNHGVAIAMLAVYITGYIERDFLIPGGPFGGWTPVLQAVAFPLSALRDIDAMVAGDVAVAPLVSLARIAWFAILWLAVGVVGIRWSLRTGRLAKAQAP
ncbi:MAG: hypothetical protein OXH66_01920 [Gemmatimonadetes bacterium]|nr:hypothetical protein [Gemmatimonadota bacterium]